MFDEIFENLNDEQKAAVEHGEGPLLIIAGAGTGKTSVITSRIFSLIQNHKLTPEQILAVTFTEKASEEMEERVDVMLPLGYSDMWIHTFHALAERILRMHALDIGLPADFELLTDIEQRIFMREHLFDFDFEYFDPLRSSESLIAGLLQHFSRAKDEDVNVEKYKEYAEKFEKSDADDDEKAKVRDIAKAYETYQNILLKEGKLDFGDVIMYCLELFRKRPHILKKYQEQFRFILVDEFQDTNVSQYELIKLLAGDDLNLTVCADDDQAIYKWRGASISNVLTFKQDYSHAKQVVLTTNYRSVQDILDISYSSIQHNNPDRLEIKNDINKKLSAHAGEGEQPIYAHMATLEQEVVYVLNEMISARNENPDLKWSDFAVLVRSNSAAEPFISLLSKKDIPFDFASSRGLYRKPEIMDVMAYLKILTNYFDNAAFYRVVNMSVFGLSYADIVPLIEASDTSHDPLFHTFVNHNDIAGLSEEARKKIEHMLSLIEKHAKLAQEKEVGEVLLAFLDESGYLRNIQSEKNTEAEKKVLNISLLFKKIQEFQSGGDGHGQHLTKDFVAEIDVLQKMGDDPAPAKLQDGPDAVKIMTIHGSKGLEFDTVFVVNMVQGRFPVRRRRESIPFPEALIEEVLPEGDAHIQEERRLFYVALTRAKRKLYITSAEDYGGKRKKKVSPFVGEIQEMCEFRSVSEDSDVMDLIISEEKKIEPQRFKYQLPSKFSYTQITVFENCPKQYKYRHILGIGGKGNPAASYGNSLHNALADFYQEIIDARQPDLFSDDGSVGTLDRLMELFEERWISAYYMSKKHETRKKEQGREALMHYFEVNKDSLNDVWLIEKGFNVKIGEHTFRGKIDRMDDIGDDKVVIVDYKTGREKSQREVDKDKQLTLYAIAAEQVFGKKLEKVILYFLNEGVAIESVRSMRDQENFKNEVDDIVKDMQQSQFEATPGFQCKYCDYFGICEDRAS